MVSFLFKLVIASLLFISLTVYAQPIDLQQGQYWRPPREQVSGIVGTRTPFRRCPCPAVNSLANHGFIPRDGRDVSSEQLIEAFFQVYGIERAVVRNQLTGFPRTFDLDILSTHNLIEHDASLFHDDLAFGQDPISINQNLVNEFIGASQNGFIGADEIVAIRTKREAESRANNPQYSLDHDPRLLSIAYIEAALILLVMGDSTTQTISTAHAESFFAQERIPDDYVKPQRTVTQEMITSMSGQLEAAVPRPKEQEEKQKHHKKNRKEKKHKRGKKNRKGKKRKHLVRRNI